MSESPPIAPEEEVLSTLHADGKRRWLYPRLAKGAWLTRRRVVGWGLILLFNLLPWVRMGGHPLVLLDLVERKFHLLGVTFQSGDLPLLALLLVGWFLTIFLATALLGRVWCGWVCPQTVYMEFVYRPLERLCFGRSGTGGKPAEVAVWRRLLLWAAYLAVSLWLAHVFLAYFVGVDRLFGLHGIRDGWVTRSPMGNPGGFCVVFLVTCGMLFDFAFWREQMCTIACPYGRFQSALLDRHSPIVSYDAARGEPRGKPRKEKKAQGQNFPLPVLARLGDCIDCGMCVEVCPTGIDIRKGMQMECLHCTQCMDACDTVMRKWDRPTGLIRYATQAGLAGEVVRRIRPRVILYPLILLVVFSLFGILLSKKTGVGMAVSRAPRTLYVMLPDGRVENSLEMTLVNRTSQARRCDLKLDGPEGLSWEADGLKAGEPPVALAPEEERKLLLRVRIPVAALARRSLVKVSVDDRRGQVQTDTVRLLGPSASVMPAAAPEPATPKKP